MKRKRISCKMLTACLLTMALVCTMVATTVVQAKIKLGDGKFYPDYLTQDEVAEQQKQLNVDVVSEGAVLLKNQESALPLGKGTRVTLFGITSVLGFVCQGFDQTRRSVLYLGRRSVKKR